MRTIQERVARGVALLDRKRPGWEEGINLSTLDISDNDNCVLAQLYGTYPKGLKSIGLWGPGTTFGFLVFDHRAGTFEWKRAIAERRLAKAEVLAEAKNIVNAEYIRTKWKENA